MSLINDALRRANLKPQESKTASGIGVTLQPVEYKRDRKAGLYLLAGPLAVGLLGLSTWLLWSAGRPTPKTNSPMGTTGNEALPRVVVAAHGKALPAAKLAPSIQQENPEVRHQLNVDPAARTNLVVQPAPSSTTPASAKLIQEEKPSLPALADGARTEVPFPKLKLQGIYFRRTNPSVLINGRTLFIGDRVEGARVVTIDRQTVTVEFSGQINLLTL